VTIKGGMTLRNGMRNDKTTLSNNAGSIVCIIVCIKLLMLNHLNVILKSFECDIKIV
jgi:hypothetical protein